ncbi:MAG: hypothetical protein LRY71_13080 [Bacillaceae bacterium]|nr:hypothetical protein [Bacillaceae bacterium]
MSIFLKRAFKRNEKRHHSGGEENEPSVTNHHATIGKVAAFFAHEIRNPLTTIIGFSKYLEQENLIKSNPTISNYISIIKDEALRMEILIKELLSLSKTHLEDDNLSIIDVKHSIEKIITIYTMQADKQNVRFEKKID